MNKSLTLEEILPNGRGVWIPIDHGVSDYPVSGLENLEQLIIDLIAAEVDVIIAHKGVVPQPLVRRHKQKWLFIYPSTSMEEKIRPIKCWWRRKRSRKTRRSWCSMQQILAAKENEMIKVWVNWVNKPTN